MEENACCKIKISSEGDRVHKGPSKVETREQRADILTNTLATVKVADMREFLKVKNLKQSQEFSRCKPNDKFFSQKRGVEENACCKIKVSSKGD